MEVIHDWPDAESVAILSAIRRAAAISATVLVIENVLPDNEVDQRGQTSDIIMLGVTRRQRADAEPVE
jgi:hypothetical protein